MTKIPAPLTERLEIYRADLILSARAIKQIDRQSANDKNLWARILDELDPESPHCVTSEEQAARHYEVAKSYLVGWKPNNWRDLHPEEFKEMTHDIYLAYEETPTPELRFNTFGQGTSPKLEQKWLIRNRKVTSIEWRKVPYVEVPPETPDTEANP